MKEKTKKSRRRRAPELTGAVPTVKQVAAAAGVSTATVSRVMAGLAGVRPDVRERVQEAARALRYQPNRVARNLRVRTTRTIGVVIPDIENPFFTRVICGIEDVLHASGYSLLLAHTNENPTRERISLASLEAEGVAGIIFTATVEQRADYAELIRPGRALVAVSRVPEGMKVDAVTVTNAEGARTAVAHLARLGHRRIGYIGGPPPISTARDRLAGYHKALAGAQLRVSRELIQHADFREAGGFRAMETLLDLGDRPTAVFVGSNLMTLGALQAIHKRGLDVPRQIAIVGFDDAPWASSVQPPLTVIAQPAFEVGTAAARIILDRLRDPNAPIRHIQLNTTLIIRASCGARAAALHAAGD